MTISNSQPDEEKPTNSDKETALVVQKFTEEERRVFAAEQASFVEKELLSSVETGDRSLGEASLRMASCCDFWGVALPGWACSEIGHAYNQFISGVTNTLEEAFNFKKTLKKRMAEENERRLAHQVYAILIAINKRGYPIDECAFEVSGEILNISGGLANKYYQGLLNSGVRGVTGKFTKPRGKAGAIHIGEETLLPLYELVDKIYKKRGISK